MPAAAPTFSTITCWPKLMLRCGAKTRAKTSNAPPAANGTTMVTGRVGQSCACADEHKATSAAAAAAILILGMAVLPDWSKAPYRDEPAAAGTTRAGSIQLHAEFPKDRGGVVGGFLDQGAKFRRAR